MLEAALIKSVRCHRQMMKYSLKTKFQVRIACLIFDGLRCDGLADYLIICALFCNLVDLVNAHDPATPLGRVRYRSKT